MVEATPPAPQRSGLACVSLLAQFHEKTTNPAQLLHHLALVADEPFITPHILACLRHIDLKARSLTGVDWDRLQRVPLPVIAELAGKRFVLIAKAAPDKLLIHDPAEKKPRVVLRADFLPTFAGIVILATRRASLAGLGRHFDIRWFIPELLRYRALFGQVLLASFFIQTIALITPLFFQVVVDKVLVHQSWTTLDILVMGLCAVAVFDTALQALRAYVLTHTTSRIDVTLGARLFEHLLNLPLAYFHARRVGDTVARVRELETIRGFLTGSALTAALDALFVVVFLSVMFSYSIPLTFIIVGTIPLYVGLCAVVSPILKARVEEKFRRNADSQAFLVESINGLDTIKSTAIEPQFRRRWNDQLAAYVQASFRAANLAANASQTAQLISKITNAAVLWLGASLVIQSEMTVGMLVAFNMLSGQVISPILRLAQLWQEFQQVGVSIARLGDVLNTKAELSHASALTNLPTLQGAVTFDHVTFRYQPDTSPAIQDVTFSITPGEVIGLVGASGSGKSTLANLIQRLYIPEKGRILIDGNDIARIDPTWLRRQLGVVSQKTFLFHRSIRENIALTAPGAPIERVMAAAKLSGAHDFIIKLPDGYDTMVGEHGSTLSGGQAQRLAIARALISNPRLLIFDEATSALDYESEQIIQAHMQQICRGRTVFIIAHRLSTVRNANRIFVMQSGQIVEEGTHDTLVARNGAYARLYSLQLGDRAPLPAPLRAA